MENENQLNIGTNLKILTFENSLKQIISECELPVSIIYYILNNTTLNIKELYNQQVNIEYNEYIKTKDKNKEKSSLEGKEEKK